MPGGAGGVGHLAIQLAVERGARVIASAGPDNHDFLRELGAEPDRLHARGRPRARARALDRATAPTPRWTSGAATAAPRCSQTLRRGGRMVSLASPPPEPRDGYEVHYIFVRPSGYDLGEHITPLVQEGRLKPHVEEVYPARAGGRGARAPRGRATCAASSCSVFRAERGGGRRGSVVASRAAGAARVAARVALPRARHARGCAAAAARRPAAPPRRRSRARSRRPGWPRPGRRCGRSGPCR